MTNDERWYSIINRAMKNGYEPFIQMKLQLVDEHYVRFIDDEGFADLSLEKIIFCHDFAKALWGERKDNRECDCGVIPSGFHLVNCATQLCVHCKGRIHIANPTGYCDHVHHPEGCRICQLLSMNWKDHLQELVLAEDYLEYIEKTLKEDI